MSRPIALVGIPGAGKSAVAPRLATLLGGRAEDLDERLEAETGQRVRELFAERGEPDFRRLETRALEHAIAAGARVIACGGGIVTGAESRALLARRCHVVWLEVSPAEASRRLDGERDRRPLLAGGDLESRLRELLDARAEWYRAVAAVRERTDGRSPDQVAATIAQGVRDGGAA